MSYKSATIFFNLIQKLYHFVTALRRDQTWLQVNASSFHYFLLFKVVLLQQKRLIELHPPFW